MHQLTQICTYIFRKKFKGRTLKTGTRPPSELPRPLTPTHLPLQQVAGCELTNERTNEHTNKHNGSQYILADAIHYTQPSTIAQLALNLEAVGPVVRRTKLPFGWIKPPLCWRRLRHYFTSPVYLETLPPYWKLMMSNSDLSRVDEWLTDDICNVHGRSAAVQWNRTGWSPSPSIHAWTIAVSGSGGSSQVIWIR